MHFKVPLWSTNYVFVNFLAVRENLAVNGTLLKANQILSHCKPTQHKEKDCKNLRSRVTTITLFTPLTIKVFYFIRSISQKIFKPKMKIVARSKGAIKIRKSNSFAWPAAFKKPISTYRSMKTKYKRQFAFVLSITFYPRAKRGFFCKLGKGSISPTILEWKMFQKCTRSIRF